MEKEIAIIDRGIDEVIVNKEIYILLNNIGMPGNPTKSAVFFGM